MSAATTQRTPRITVDDSAAAPPGYKRTEVGVIPEDWGMWLLGSFVSITSGASPSLFRFSANGTPYFKVEQLGNAEKYLGSGDTPYLFELGPTVSGESVVFAKRGAAIALNKVRILRQASFMDTNLMALTPQAGLECEYLYYALTQIGLWRFADTTSIPQINNKHIKPLAFPLPSVPEQRAIAKALSDVDELLGALEALIAKKRAIKQAAMQQLLTGRTRLPGFSGEWEVKRVLELGDVVTGGTPRTDVSEYWGDTYPWVTPTDISGGRDMFSSERWLTQAGLDAVRELPPNTVLVTCIASIGKNAILKTSGACNQQINAVVPNETSDAVFLYYLFEASKQYLLANAGVTATSIISKAAFSKLMLRVPLLDERTAIATVLADMDAEVAALERRRDKTRAIKQGMMQQLLTGRVRLVEPEVAG